MGMQALQNDRGFKCQLEQYIVTYKLKSPHDYRLYNITLSSPERAKGFSRTFKRFKVYSPHSVGIKIFRLYRTEQISYIYVFTSYCI